MLIRNRPVFRRTSLTAITVCLLLATFVGAEPGDAETSTLHPAAEGAIPYTTVACSWSPWIKESAGIYYECPGGTVLAGIQHQGDENGDTRYQCCALSPSPVEKTACAWSSAIRESNSLYYCPGWQAMTGREHSGDENGDTKYQCCDLNNPSGRMWPDDVSCRWVGPQKQSNSDLQCSGGGVLRGRSHQGDENGDTDIYCCNYLGND